MVAHVPAAVGTLAAHAARQDGQRLHAYILTELEIFEVSHLHALMIAPGVLYAATCLTRTHGRLPAVCIPESVTAAMHHTAAGETHELGVEVSKGLSQVLAQPVTLVGVLREKRYHIYIHHAGGKGEQLQRCTLTVLTCGEGALVLLPVAA